MNEEACMTYQQYHLNWIDPKKTDADKLVVEWPEDGDTVEETEVPFFWQQSDIDDDAKRYNKHLEGELRKLSLDEKKNKLLPQIPATNFEMDVKIYQLMVELPLNDFKVSMTDLLTPYSRDRFVKVWDERAGQLFELMKKLGPLRFYLKIKKQALKTKQAKGNDSPLLVNDLTSYQQFFWPNQQTVDAVFN